ncbi:hypothetical protein COOONC_11207 [Cooperia oncophora]
MKTGDSTVRRAKRTRTQDKGRLAAASNTSLTDDVDTLTNRNLYSDKVLAASERFNHLKKQNDNWEQEMDSLRKQVDRVRENVSAAKEEMKGYQLRDEEKRIEQIMESRVRILENMRSNMADEAWRWYQANRDRFRHPVYVPILHMTVPDAKSAMLLENLIALRDLPMFIFGCKEDEALLTDRRHNWKLNSTVVAPSQVNLSSLSSTVTQEMKGFGFTRFAADLFTSPDVVKHYMCSVARLHQVPIGSARSNEYYDEIKSAFANTPYKLYLTDRYRVQFTVSKYGSHEVIGQQSELRSPAQYFVAHTSSPDDKSNLKRSDNSFELEYDFCPN